MYNWAWPQVTQNIAEALSCLTQEVSNESKNVEEYIQCVAENAAPRAVPIQEIEASDDDEEIAVLKKCLQTYDCTVCKQFLKLWETSELC